MTISIDAFVVCDFYRPRAQADNSHMYRASIIKYNVNVFLLIATSMSQLTGLAIFCPQESVRGVSTTFLNIKNNITHHCSLFLFFSMATQFRKLISTRWVIFYSVLCSVYAKLSQLYEVVDVYEVLSSSSVLIACGLQLRLHFSQ